MPMAGRMQFCYVFGLLVSLGPLLVGAQPTPVPHVIVRKEQVQEVERNLERVGRGRSLG